MKADYKGIKWLWNSYKIEGDYEVFTIGGIKYQRKVSPEWKIKWESNDK